jgi:muramoyltetrapeptide carboxypeptidase LdcA involved in peptidoglycan recycling
VTRLYPGCHLRVIAPAQSLAIITPQVRQLADERLAQLGFSVSFGTHAEESGPLASASLQSRLSDLHEAFADPTVDGILTAIGGFNSHDLLPHIDWGLIQANPKPLCGYSDITALQNAIYSITGQETYSGPHYSTFGCLKGVEPVVDWFKKCLCEAQDYDLTPSAKWSDDLWYLDQEKRTFLPNEGPWIIREGRAEGILIGGNLSTLCLLSGTRFLPDLRGKILLIEDDYESRGVLFDRQFKQLSHQRGFDEVQAILIGRFQQASRIDRQILELILEGIHPVPAIANLDVGHTMPLATLPIGGWIRIENERVTVCRPSGPAHQI